MTTLLITNQLVKVVAVAQAHQVQTVIVLAIIQAIQIVKVIITQVNNKATLLQIEAPTR